MNGAIDMKFFKGLRKSGMFHVTPEKEVQGDLIFKGPKTKLDLFSRDFFSTHALQDGSILGVLHDLTKVSLIDCITTHGPGRVSRGDEQYHFSSVFPHFVVFGNEHITSTDQKIGAVSFHVNDAEKLFYDFDAFGMVLDAKPHITQLLETKKNIGRDVSAGDGPMIFYFTGKNEIFKSETVLGTVSAVHRPNIHFPGPQGIRVDNKIHIYLEFKSSSTIEEATTGVYTLLLFLEIIAGRQQSLQDISFVINDQEDAPIILNVYWSMMTVREEDEEQPPHPADLPIQAARDPAYFGSVLTKWLQRDDEWRSARSGFATVFRQRHNFTIDRLVGAANMFDILPTSAVPYDVQLTQEVAEAQQEARALFKKLKNSLERDSIMGALGRLGKASLKHKVGARAKLILDLIPTCFPELVLVLNAAVDCRNYFVHGSKAKIDYTANFDQVTFFTEALEFTFAASDLIECGWDIAEWSKRYSSVSHPFDSFRLNYKPRLADLKRALG
jgi:ApeA N-terminal domain 1